MLLSLLLATVEVEATGGVLTVVGALLFGRLLRFCGGFGVTVILVRFGLEGVTIGGEEEAVFISATGALGGGGVMFKCFSIFSNLESIESRVTFHWSILLVKWLSLCSIVLMKVTISLVELIDNCFVFALLAVAFPLLDQLLGAYTELLSPLGPLLSASA